MARPRKNASKPVTRQKQEQRNDGKHIGTGPERFAPWWPLLEHVATAPSEVQVQVPLTAENLVLINEKSGWQDHKVSYPWDSSLPSPPSALPPPGVDPRLFALHHVAADYPARLHHNGILGTGHSREPRNLKALERMLRSELDEDVPSEDEYKSYVRNLSAATDPMTLTWEIYPLLRRRFADEDYRTAVGRTLDGVPPDAPFNGGLHQPRPDFVQGIDEWGFGDVRVEFLPGAVLFRDHGHSVTLAHIAGHFYGDTADDERAAEACSSHTGAALVFARNNALGYVQADERSKHGLIDADEVDGAQVVTFTTNGAVINFFAHHAVSGADGVRYHQWHLVSTNMRASYAGFRRGWTQLRNCQRHAFEAAQRLRDLLDEHHRIHGAAGWTRRRGPPPMDGSLEGESLEGESLEGESLEGESSGSESLMSETWMSESSMGESSISESAESEFPESQSSESEFPQSESSESRGATPPPLPPTTTRTLKKSRAKGGKLVASAVTTARRIMPKRKAKKTTGYDEDRDEDEDEDEDDKPSPRKRKRQA